MAIVRIWVYDGILASGVAGPVDVFSAANQFHARKAAPGSSQAATAAEALRHHVTELVISLPHAPHLPFESCIPTYLQTDGIRALAHDQLLDTSGIRSSAQIRPSRAGRRTVRTGLAEVVHMQHEPDGRSRSLSLTHEGELLLKSAASAWSAAQSYVTRLLGETGAHDLMNIARDLPARSRPIRSHDERPLQTHGP
ncbi:hypothetical protein [Trinickia sp. EG282A]|uniref:hypothetical protein n=1 Tax=Trinickia sp. EG282A TaxID=3237013 RepID=UPI0034D1BCE7